MDNDTITMDAIEMQLGLALARKYSPDGGNLPYQDDKVSLEDSFHTLTILAILAVGREIKAIGQITIEQLNGLEAS